MATARVYNPADRPVVIDDEGRTIPGRDWGEVDLSSELVSRHLAEDRLVQVDDQPEPAPEARPEPKSESAKARKRTRPSEES